MTSPASDPVGVSPLDNSDRERRLSLCRQRLKTYEPSEFDIITEQPPVMRFYREDVEFLLNELAARSSPPPADRERLRSICEGMTLTAQLMAGQHARVLLWVDFLAALDSATEARSSPQEGQPREDKL